MNGNRGFVPLIVLLAVGVPLGTLLAGSAAAPRPVAASQQRKTSQGDPKSPKKPRAAAPHETQRTDPSSPDEARQVLEGVLQRGRNTAHPPRLIFATFPDPIESPSARSFDEYLAAIRIAFESSGYSKFESWDPWFPVDGKEVEGRPWLRTPGVVLFQNVEGEQWAVFLVGETPTRGVHNEALFTALNYWLTTDSPDRADGILRVLGPSNSGAARSLANTLKKWLGDHRSVGPRSVRVVSGSATNSDNGGWFSRGMAGAPQPVCDAYAPPELSFEATVNDDDALQSFVSDYLQEQLGIGAQDTAILTESSSQYGQGFADGDELARSRTPLVLRYPPYINSVRRDIGSQAPVATPAAATDVDGEDDSSADLFSPHAALARSMAGLSLARVIRAISEEHIRAVEIVALDSEDAAFLAIKVREAFPSVVVVVLSSDVLYLRQKYALDGLLVASTYPLSLRGQRTTFAFTGIGGRLSFPSEQAEGIFNATLVLTNQHALLDYGPPLRLQAGGQTPALWMSVVSNHEVWPVEVKSRQDVVRTPQTGATYVHVEPTPAGPLVTPPDAWRPTRAIAFEAFTMVFALISLLCAGCYVWARWLASDPPPEDAPLLVRIVGRRSDDEILRGLSLSFVLLVLSILWSFIAVVDGAGALGPSGTSGSFSFAYLVWPISRVTCVVVLTVCVDAWCVWIWSAGGLLRLRFKGASEPPPGQVGIQAGDKQATGPAPAAPDGAGWRERLRAKAPRIAISIGGGLALVGLNCWVVRRWIERCGFGTELVGAAVDARCQRFVLFFDRARFFGGGVSLLATTIVLSVGYFVWYAAHLYKVWLTHSFKPLRNLSIVPGEKASQSVRARVAGELDDAFEKFESMKPSPGLWLVMGGVFAVALVRSSQVPCFERPHYRVLTACFFALFVTLLVFGAGRSLELWTRFRQLLRHLATTEILQEGTTAPSELLGYLGWPWDAQVGQAWRAAGREVSLRTGEAFARIVSTDGAVNEDEWDSYLGAPPEPEAQENGRGKALLRTLYLSSAITYLRMHLLGFLRATSAGLLVSLLVVSMYPFRGERLLLGMVVVLGTLTAVTVTVIFLQLGRDYVVARLGGKPKETPWDPEFLRGIILHAVLPLLGLLSVRFPGIGQTLGTLLGSLSGTAGAS